MYNAVPMVLAGVLYVSVPGFSGDASDAAFQPAWFDLSGLVLTGVGLLLLVRALLMRDGDSKKKED